MKDTSKMAKRADLEDIFSVMGATTLESGQIANIKVKESSTGQMEDFTKDSSKTVHAKVLEP